MNKDIKEQLITLMAGELSDATENLDDWERQAVAMMREIAQGAVQQKLEGKKGATQGAGCPANAGPRHGS